MAKIETTFKYFLVALSLIISWGAIIYYGYALNWVGVFINLILTLVSFWLIKKRIKFDQDTTIIKPKNTYAEIFKDKKSPPKLIPAVIYLLFFFASVFLIFMSRGADAIISPWQNVPIYFFGLYFLLSLILLLIIKQNLPGKTVFIFLHYLLSFSIALIVYKIGYGFDPFVHVATMELIDKTGAVEPKPLYYLGQYALIIITHKLSFIPIDFLNKILVPIFSGTLLFVSLVLNLEKWLENKTIVRTSILLLLSLPFSFMIVSTPQNLAYVFFILIVLFGLNCRQTLDKINIVLLALAAFFIHPIAGIPALIFALILSLRNSNIKRRKVFYTVGFVSLALALPLAFHLAENLNSPQEPQQLESVNSNIISQFALNWPAKENVILNSVYLFTFNLHFLYILFALSGIFIAFKHRKKCDILVSYFFAFLALLGAYLLIIKLPFAFLIDYERSDYSGRVLMLTGFTLIPFVVLAFYALISRLNKQNQFIRSSFYVFFAIILTASLYASYPRFDNFYNSRGYSVSNSDIEAVKWIEEDAEKDYIVLSNQQVSAAALKIFGFKKYFSARDSEKEIFYYPIPTGEKLYSYYLDMVYDKPSRETINEALDYTDAETAYFVLNKYWWAAPKILAEAELEANSKHEINQGEITIFKYQKTKKAP